MMSEENPVFRKLRQEVLEQFDEKYGMQPFIIASAPARVNLIGEHIDYCDGFVLPAGINRHVVIAAAPNGTAEANLYSTLLPDETVTVMLDERPVSGRPKWADYIRGVFDGFYERDFWPLPGFDAVIHSNIPLGAGLSSSAAIEVAAATLIEGLLGFEINPKNKALLCQRAEHKFAGVPCGIMDQFASVFAKKDHLVLIDCRSEEAQPIPFADDSISMVIADTNVHHKLSDGAYANRRRQTEIALSVIGKESWRGVTMSDLEASKNDMHEVVYRRAHHVVSEIDRTQQAAIAVSRGKTEQVGEMMAASHRSLRDDFEVSCAELDVMVEIAWDIGKEGGVLGSRMTGGGFGGSTITLVRTNLVEEVMQIMRSRYQKKTGIEPQIFSTGAVDGAALEEC
jgi:galactokinase